MIEFTTKLADFKKALNIVSLAIDESPELIKGQALFIAQASEALLYASNEDKIAKALLPIEGLQSPCSFTIDPKRVQTLLSNSDTDIIKIGYDDESKTVLFYVSEESDSHVSFGSLDPSTAISFEEEIQEVKEIKSLDASIFLTGIKFILGFLPGDDKNKKFSHLFVTDGVMYGSNGSSKIGAFISPDIEGANKLVIRRSMLQPIVNFIDKTDTSTIIITETDKKLIFFSQDDHFCFGFRKSLIEQPKMPISVEPPNIKGFSIEKGPFIKKINRLSLTSRDDIGIKILVKNNEISMQTISDRPSTEKSLCKAFSENTDLDFVCKCGDLKNLLGLFQASSIDAYIDKTKCIIYSKAELLVEETGKDPTKKPFTAIGLMTLARII